MNLLPKVVPLGLEWLKITYGTLPRHSYRLGPTAPVSTLCTILTLSAMHTQTLKAWKNSDPTPNQVKPIPISVICHMIAYLAQSTNASNTTFCAIADMIIIALFFLLHPSKYTDNDINPFCLEDVQLFIGDTCIQLLTAPTEQLNQACFASLTFTIQKNGVWGEVIELAHSGDPYICPVQGIICQVLYLCQYSATLNTPSKLLLPP